MEQGVCKWHTLGLSSFNRCECDAIPFLDRKESPQRCGQHLGCHFCTMSVTRKGAYRAEEAVSRWIMRLHSRFWLIQCWMSGCGEWSHHWFRENAWENNCVSLQTFLDIWGDCSLDFKAERWGMQRGPHLSYHCLWVLVRCSSCTGCFVTRSLEGSEIAAVTYNTVWNSTQILLQNIYTQNEGMATNTLPHLA